MGYWRKDYRDGTSLISLDGDGISWSRTRLKDMIGARLVVGDYECTIVIEGEGDYWQSDTYECQIGSSNIKLIKRRIEMKEKDGGKPFYGYYINRKQELVSCAKSSLANTQEFWQVIEYDLRSKTCRFYSSKEKV